MADPLLALSVRQPWADGIIHGGKDIENRSRRTSFRGPVLIHASAGMTGQEHADFNHFLSERRIDSDWQAKINPYVRRGGIVGLVDIVDCVDHSTSPWFMGKWGWVLANPRQLPFIPCRGTISPLMWAPTPEVAATVAAALA